MNKCPFKHEYDSHCFEQVKSFRSISCKIICQTLIDRIRYDNPISNHEIIYVSLLHTCVQKNRIEATSYNLKETTSQNDFIYFISQ